MKDFFIKIPNWVLEPYEKEEVMSMDKVMVYCNLYRNQTLEGDSYFMYKDYLQEIGKDNQGKKDYHLRKTKEILNKLENAKIIKTLIAVPGCVKYSLNKHQFSELDSQYVILTYPEYDAIVRWNDVSYRPYLISMLCSIKFLIYRGSRNEKPKFPIGVCSYSMDKLATWFGKDERTVRKYIKALEDLGLIARKIVRVKAKDGDFNVFTLHIPTSENNYQKKLEDAEIFIKENFGNLKTKKY